MYSNIIKITFLFLILFKLNAKPIKYTIKSIDLINKYQEAKKKLNQRKFNKSKKLLIQIINKNKNFIEAKILLTKLNQRLGKFNDCKKVLDEIAKNIPAKGFYHLKYEVSYMYYRCGLYKKALEIIDKILTKKINNKLKKKAKILKYNLGFSINAINNPIDFKPILMPKPLNKFAAQYFPVLSIDQNTILFTGRADYTLSADESIYMSTKDEKGRWLEPKLISKSINTNNNEGACSLSSDGNILIFSAYERKENYGTCDLYISYKKGNKWTKPKNLGPNINSKGWQSQPSLSADGKTLYFASKRKGNIGKKDIWKSVLIKGEWSKAINLGKIINSLGNEISPFLHPNGKTLFFASDRSPSLGGLDLYYSELINDKWTKPENLGYPINNFRDQVSLFITADGEKGYYAAGTQKGIYYNGKLYEFKIPKKMLPNPVCVYIKGNIQVEKKEDQLNAKVYVYNIEKDKIELEIDITPENGNFCIPLNKGTNYTLYISKKKYIVQKININLKAVSIKGINKQINLKIAKSGQRQLLKNILFDFDKYDLKKEFESELRALIIFLKDNKNIKILIEGYTDNIGSKKYNKILSMKRAKAVYDYLINKGISSNRLKYKGLGQINNKKEVNDDGLRKIDRKVSFRIINIKSNE